MSFDAILVLSPTKEITKVLLAGVKGLSDPRSSKAVGVGRAVQLVPESRFVCLHAVSQNSPHRCLELSIAHLSRYVQIIAQYLLRKY